MTEVAYNNSMNKVQIDHILELIYEQYPKKFIELDFETPFQLLIAVMLSAQMTDKGVNKATPKLFSVVKQPSDMKKFTLEEVTEMIRSVNYYRNKAKHLYATAELLVREYDEVIPDTLEEIQKLPGVGVKTAKVVLSHLYDAPYI